MSGIRAACVLLLLALLAPAGDLPGAGIVLNGLLVAAATYLLLLRNREPLPLRAPSLAMGAFFAVLQALLLSSWALDWLVGAAGLSDLLSAWRPAMLAVATAAFTSAFGDFETRAHATWIRLVRVILVLATGHYVLVASSGAAMAVSRVLYGPLLNDVFAGEATSFFGTSYYAAYVYFFVFVFLLSDYLVQGEARRLLWVCWCLLLILAASSKPAAALALVAVPLAVAARLGAMGRLAFVGGLAVAGAAVVWWIGFEELRTLALAGNYLVSSFVLVIENPQAAGTFAVRYTQVADVIRESWNHAGFGVGLGRGVLLESWPAYLGHRYGLIGLVAYVLLWLGAAAHALRVRARVSERELRVMITAVGAWMLSAPLLNVSGGMMESGKTAFFNCAMLGMYLAWVHLRPAELPRGERA